MWAKIGHDIVWGSNAVKLLGVTIDNHLKFCNQVPNSRSKANRTKEKFLSSQNRHTLFKTFIESSFKYCPFVWMFHGRQTNNKIIKLHEKTLRVAYNDTATTFIDLLMDSSFTIHYQNIQSLAI